MRILHLATFLQGGAGRAIADLALAQRAAGHDVTVVASDRGVPGYGNYPAYLEELAARQVPVHRVDSMFDRALDRNLHVVATLDRLVARGHEPHVIHAHAAVPALVGLLFCGTRRRAAAIVQTMHGWGVSKTADQAAADVAIMNLVDRVVVPSASAARPVVAHGVDAARISVLPYGVAASGPEPDEADRARLAEMAAARRSGALVVACVGTLGPRKNQALLVDAVDALSDVPVLAVIVGDGDQAGLSAAVAARGCEARIRIHGYSRAARRIAAAADVLVLPSRAEGQPLAILEAFCDGPIAAVSRIPELAELVEDGGLGVMFRSDDAEELAAALRTIARMSGRERDAIRQRARARYASRFTIGAMVEAHVELYRTLLAAADARRHEPPAA